MVPGCIIYRGIQSRVPTYKSYIMLFEPLYKIPNLFWPGQGVRRNVATRAGFRRSRSKQSI